MFWLNGSIMTEKLSSPKEKSPWRRTRAPPMYFATLRYRSSAFDHLTDSAAMLSGAGVGVMSSALARAVGLSQAAVRDRVLELIQSNTITIQAHTMPEAMGIGGFAGLAVKASGPVGPLAEALKLRPESTVVVRTLGRFDLLAEVWFEDRDHLANLLDDLRAVPGMGSIDTVPYLRMALEEFGYGFSR